MEFGQGCCPNGRGLSYFVMPALVAGIHVFLCALRFKTWMAGINPAMTPY